MTDVDPPPDEPASVEPSPVATLGEPAAPADATKKGGRRKRRKRSQRREIIEWSLVVIGALLAALIIKTFLFQAFYIPSQSMEPTLKVGDRVIVNKLSYKLHDIRRGDIVVFRRPSESGDSITVERCDGTSLTIPRSKNLEQENVDDLIKRVVALPGETIERRDDGHIYINGNMLKETYVAAPGTTPRFSFDAQCIKVPKDTVFVLGDNRGNSQASNYFGPIAESLIVGRAFLRVWPTPGTL